jgi:competence protein ComGC
MEILITLAVMGVILLLSYPELKKANALQKEADRQERIQQEKEQAFEREMLEFEITERVKEEMRLKEAGLNDD